MSELDTLVEQVKVPQVFFFAMSGEPVFFFDGDRFNHYVNRTFDYVDVATFSVSKSKWFPLTKIRRLLYSLGSRQVKGKAQQIKRLEQNHVKLVICYKQAESQPTTIYVGSFNLTHGTNINCMYAIRDEHKEAFTNFFELLWNTAK